MKKVLAVLRKNGILHSCDGGNARAKSTGRVSDILRPTCEIQVTLHHFLLYKSSLINITKYIIHLERRLLPYKTKRIEVSAVDSPSASKLIAEKYPDWIVSMFWSDWQNS